MIQNLPNIKKARKIAKRLVRDSFKNDYGDPFELTNGQADIFLSIYLKIFPRNFIMTYTQYGKTDVVAMALICRTQAFQEQFTIVAGKKKKGMLIMERVIQHVFDSPNFYCKLELDKNMPLDRLKRERSKEKITWLGGGGIRVLSAQTGNRNVIKEALIGEGGQNLVLEEAPHISDATFAMVIRMLMGHKENFLVKIGNAFNRNHFFRSSMSEKYNKIVVDYHTGIQEGRVTEEQIDEVREFPFFGELYEVKFPDISGILPSGYKRLITDDLLKSAYISEEEGQKLIDGGPKLGADFAGGGSDRSAYVIRWPKVMKLLSTNKIADTMQQVPIIEDIIEDQKVDDTEVSVDYGGLGQGIGDRLTEKECYVNCVRFGQSAPDDEKDKYKNMRSYMYYELFLWIKNGGKIIKNDGFNEVLMINYKVDSERKLQIESKKDMKKRIQEVGESYKSPDIPDAAALTFADNIEAIGEDEIDLI